MSKVKVLVADEETLFREGVCALLKTLDGIELVGEATNGRGTIEMVQEKNPDVVLMNITMPILDGAMVTRQIRKVNNSTKVLLVSQYHDRDHVLSGLKAGARGYISKRATASELASAILVVYQGDYFLQPSLARMMVDDYLQYISQSRSYDLYTQLTQTEKQVLKLLSEGHEANEVAHQLNIAVRTAISHKARIMRKLGIHRHS